MDTTTRLIASLLTLIAARPGLLISYPVARSLGFLGSRQDFIDLGPLAASEASSAGAIAFWRKQIETLEVYRGRWTTTSPKGWAEQGAEYAEERLSLLLTHASPGQDIGRMAELLLETWTLQDLSARWAEKLGQLGTGDLRTAAETRLWVGFAARLKSFDWLQRVNRPVAVACGA